VSRVPRPLVRASCDYCGSTDVDLISGPLQDDELADALPPAYAELSFRFGQCRQCGLVYLPERPHPDDVGVYYPDDYKCFVSYDERGAIMKMLAERVARAKLRQIRSFMPPGNNTLLDYGCGSGTWLALLQSMGCTYRMIGTDVVAAPLDALRKRGMEAHHCDEATLHEHVADGSVGVIHLFHVIEHLPNADAVLRALYRALAPGGVIIGQTPNVASFGRRVWKDDWNQWHAPQHFVLFSHDTLRRHAERAGFEVVSITSSMSSATQWALSPLHRWAKWRGRAFRSIHEPLYPPLILAAMPIVTVESVLSHTCHMDFVLRRPAR
jgi:2-polyprenyl-3-methyl-5-hydroxy-6-metoxy-1,4-benzoquinol methylase